jgi:K+-sensing histidine kinase KdpD
VASLDAKRELWSFPNSERAVRVLWRYGFAVIVVGTALGLSLLLQNATHFRILFPFFAAVIVAGWIGGRGPAWASVVMTLLAVDYFFAAPIYDLGVNARDQAFFVPFTVSTVLAGWCGSLRKRVESWSAQPRKASMRDDGTH